MTWLNVNSGCNMRCKWCYNGMKSVTAGGEMSLSLARELVDISKELGVTHVNIIGGEPTLWAGLFELNDYIRAVGLGSGLITNAMRFSEDAFLDAYRAHPNDRISISVKSADEEEFLRVTGSREFGHTQSGICRALELFDTGVTTVYNSLVGFEGLRRIAERSRELGARSIIVNMCSPVLKNGKAELGYSIPAERIAEETVAIADMLEALYADEYELDIQMPLCLFPEEFVDAMLLRGKIQTICQMFSRGGLNFNTEGDVLPCNELHETIIARRGIDFNDAKSLYTHLNREALREFYAGLLRYPSAQCDVCRRRDDCRGGCLMNWLIYEPSICRAVK
jgi:radical SAM protein with 4Fe4S-binding SPASM domain